jgi:hypothetical protein
MIISRCMLMLFYLDWSAFFQANCVFSGASTAANWRLFIRRGTYYCSDCSAYRDSTDLYLLSPAIDCPIDRSTCPFSYGTLSSQKEHALPAGSLISSISVARTLQSGLSSPLNHTVLGTCSEYAGSGQVLLAFPPTFRKMATHFALLL